MARHSFSATLALLVLSLLIFLVEVRATTQCYYSDSTKSSDTPCYTDGRVSACCGEDSICLTNGLCLSLAQPYRLSRGSCTDYAWGSSCPQYCTNAQPSAGASVVWLTNGTTGGSTGDETEYCCNSVVISVNDTLVCSKIHGNTQDPFPIQLDMSLLV
ncbi:hypothetical protein N7488_006517 [Penicillium malachiteum]|nr:hypothetical protein N7488_006517 [Penicillium malachiteum]